MNHGAGVAVKIQNKVVNRKIANHRLHGHRVLNGFPLGQAFQRCDQAGFVAVAHVRFRVIEQIRVAFEGIVCIFQQDVFAAVHPVWLSFHLSGRQAPAVCRWLHHAVRLLADWEAVLRFLRQFGERSHPRPVEGHAVAAPAAHELAVRLIQFAVVFAVIALQEGFLHALDRQIQPPRLAVDGDGHIAAERCSHAHGGHHLIAEEILHAGVVLNQIIEAQLIQTMVGIAAVIVIKFDFEAVAVIAIGRDLRQGGIALGADGDIRIDFVINDNGAGGIFFVLAGCEECIPVRHADVDGMHPFGRKQSALIAHGHGGGLQAEALRVHHENGQEQRDDQNSDADPVKCSMG